jgi:hypothetical protein
MSIPITDDVARRAVNELLQGRTHAASSFALAVAPATTTTVVKIGISANSVILTTAYIALTSLVPAKDRFVVTHTASADARTHHYVWVTGLAT